MTPDSAQIDLKPHHKRTAYHECGHAMLCLKRPRTFEFDQVVVYASPRFDEDRGCVSFGRCDYGYPVVCNASREERLSDRILETLTGPEAERLFDQTLTAETAGWDGDHHRAREFIKLLLKLPNDEEISNRFDAYRHEAVEFVSEHWAKISKIASILAPIIDAFA
jgi:hypothetical protein